MSLDDIHDIDDHSEITMKAMIARLRASRTEEQFVYRETELDEMWRIVDIAIRRADQDPAELDRLREIRAAIERSHDLVGMELQPIAAAQALEAILPRLAPGT